MRRSVVTTTGILPLMIVLLCGQQAPADLQKAGEQAYLFSYPMVPLDVWRRATGEPGPPNTFTHTQEFPTDKSRSGAAPNADTLYSVAWLDLSKEPVLLHVPDTRDRYYLMQVVDAWGDTVSSPGKRTTGTAEGWFALVGPRWTGTLPEGTRRIDVPTNTAYLLGRIQTNTAADYANVHVLQQQFRLMPLSNYPTGKEISPPVSPRREMSTPHHQTVAAMTTAQLGPAGRDRARAGVVIGPLSLSIGSTNARSRSAWSASGTAAVPIESLHLDAPASSRGGRVTVAAGLSYLWDAESKAAFARLIGVNHDAHLRDRGRKIVFNRIQVLLNVLAWDSTATLNVLGATNRTN